MLNENDSKNEVHIEDEMRKAYIDYSMSVIVGRALPDARDGLKPANRRILYAMRERGWTKSKAFVKCAKVVGEVIGNFHPHGDSAVYDTLVRMAQDFSMRYMMIDGQGNFGSIDGDPPAAYRYTECRLERIAEEMLADIDKDTVDTRDNFDETLTEPVVLPARVPGLLVNGSTGIAVGMATNIPPHNLAEIVDATIHLIDDDDATVQDLMQYVKGPDFPTAGQICGFNAIRDMYEKGRGLIKMRGKAEIEENEKSRDRIIITEIPYAVNKTTLIEKIAELVHNKRIEGISDIRDESDKKGIRIVIELKRGAVASIILNHIYKHTQLQSTFGAIMLALDNGRPKVMNLKELLQCFIRHRFEVITRRTQYELARAEARAHILEGFRIALDNLDEVVKVIRKARDRHEARAELMARFGFSELQANAILEMRLYQLTGLEREKIEDEYRAIMERIEYLKDLLAHEDKLYDVIKADLADLKETYQDPRRTELVPDDTEIDIEDLIEDRSCVITLSHTGYIKRVPTETYREQRRGGKGVQSMGTKDEDYVEHVFAASTHDYLLFFTRKGRVYWKKAYQVPESGRTSRGKALVNFLDIGEDDAIASLIRVREFSDEHHLVFATQKGVVKKTNLSAFGNPRSGGIIAISIDEDDRLISVKQTTESDTVMLITRQGMSIRFSEQRLRSQGRATRGVKGITLGKENDAVVSLEVVEPEGTLLVSCENGYGKRTAFSEYPVQNRGGKGVITIKATERNGIVISAHAVSDELALMMVTAKGQMVRFPISDLRTISRNTQGVRLINLAKGDRLISTAPVEPVEEVEEAAEEAAVPAAEEETTAPPSEASTDE